MEEEANDEFALRHEKAKEFVYSPRMEIEYVVVKIEDCLWMMSLVVR